MSCSIVDSDYSATEGNNTKDGIVKGGLKDSASSVDGTYTDGMDPEAGYALIVCSVCDRECTRMPVDDAPILRKKDFLGLLVVL